MAASRETDDGTFSEPLRPTPQLSPRLLALWPVVITGTTLWGLLTVVLAIAHYGFEVTPPIWLWTAISGVLLGLLGMGVMVVQRSGSRRGLKGAQRGL